MERKKCDYFEMTYESPSLTAFNYLMHSVPLMEVRGRHGDRNDFLSQTYTFEKE
jgi:hypothetical protein